MGAIPLLHTTAVLVEGAGALLAGPVGLIKELALEAPAGKLLMTTATHIRYRIAAQFTEAHDGY